MTDNRNPLFAETPSKEKLNPLFASPSKDKNPLFARQNSGQSNPGTNANINTAPAAMNPLFSNESAQSTQAGGSSTAQSSNFQSPRDDASQNIELSNTLQDTATAGKSLFSWGASLAGNAVNMAKQGVAQAHEAVQEITADYDEDEDDVQF